MLLRISLVASALSRLRSCGRDVTFRLLMSRAMPPSLLPTPYRGLDCQEGNGAAIKIAVYMKSLFVAMHTALDDLDEGEKATLAHKSDGHAPFVDSGSHRPHDFAFSSYHNLNPIPATPTLTLTLTLPLPDRYT